MDNPRTNIQNHIRGLWILVGTILISLILISFSGCGPQSALPYHQGLQKEATFENRLGNVESFTKGSYLDDLKRLKDQLNEMEKWARKHQSNKEILAKMTEIRSMITELENQKQ